MGVNPQRQREDRVTTGGLAAWLVRNADPRTDPNAGDVHRWPSGGRAGRDAPEPEHTDGDVIDRLGRRAVLVLFALTTALAGVFLLLWIAGDLTWLPQAEEPATAQPAPLRSEPPAPNLPTDQARVSPPPTIAGRTAADPVAMSRPVEVPQSVPQPRRTEPPPERLTLAPPEIGALLSRGEALLNAGDVAAARPLLERAALAGDATAALRLGQSYDPGYLANAGLRETAGNLGLAIFWYRRGQELGNGTAAFLARKLETAARAGWAPVSARPPAWRP